MKLKQVIAEQLKTHCAKLVDGALKGLTAGEVDYAASYLASVIGKHMPTEPDKYGVRNGKDDATLRFAIDAVKLKNGRSGVTEFCEVLCNADAFNSKAGKLGCATFVTVTVPAYIHLSPEAKKVASVKAESVVA